jgi:hypothetical protein
MAGSIDSVGSIAIAKGLNRLRVRRELRINFMVPRAILGFT